MTSPQIAVVGGLAVALFWIGREFLLDEQRMEGGWLNPPVRLRFFWRVCPCEACGEIREQRRRLEVARSRPHVVRRKVPDRLGPPV